MVGPTYFFQHRNPTSSIAQCEGHFFRKGIIAVLLQRRWRLPFRHGRRCRRHDHSRYTPLMSTNFFPTDAWLYPTMQRPFVTSSAVRDRPRTLLTLCFGLFLFRLLPRRRPDIFIHPPPQGHIDPPESESPKPRHIFNAPSFVSQLGKRKIRGSHHFLGGCFVAPRVGRGAAYSDIIHGRLDFCFYQWRAVYLIRTKRKPMPHIAVFA